MLKIRSLVGCGFLLLFMLQVPLATAQDRPTEDPSLRLDPALRFAHLNSDDGLVQNTVRAILQDRNGFMWFGTEAGLSRYDGYRFTNFQHNPNNPNSLSHNHVRDLYEDRDGMIWVATEGGGIDSLDPASEMFTHYYDASDTSKAIFGDRYFAIIQDSRGHIWAGGGLAFGLTDYDPVSQSAITYFGTDPDPNKFQFHGIGDIVESADRQLWFVANPAVVRHDLTDGSFTSYHLAEYEELRMKSLRIDSQGTLWVGGTQGLYRYDETSDSFEHVSDIPDIVDILEVESGQLWLATSQGLYRFDPQSQEVRGPERPYAGVANSLHSENLNRLYQSRSGLIWIGGENGIDIYDPHLEQFAYYPHSVPDMPASLAAGEIQAIHITSDNTAWIGVDSVLHRVNLDSSEITLYNLKDYDLGTEEITAIYQDHSGILWLGRLTRGLVRFDPDRERFSEFPLAVPETAPSDRPGPPPGDQAESPATPSGEPGQPPAPPREAEERRGPPPLESIIVAIDEDPENRLWLADSGRGLYRIDETRETVVRYAPPEVGAPPGVDLPDGEGIRPPIMSLRIDQAGNAWLTDLNGFYRFNPVDENYTPFRILTPELSDTWTEASFEDENGMIWVAARDGLFRLDPRTEGVRHFTTNDGLPTNYLVGILQAANGDLWLSSKKGLSRFTPSTETFRNYDRFDGLQGSEFNARVFAQAPDGRMFFGGTNGLTVFDPLQITDSTYQPPVVLDDFELFNQSVTPGPESPLRQPIWQTDSLALDYTQNIFSFEFAVLNYAFGDINQYRYRLDGFEDHWNETDSARRFATYTNLPAGQYTFRVQAANRDSVWSDKDIALELTMRPPWWATVWFRLLAVLATVGLVFGAYQWRVRAMARHNQELQHEVERQTQALVERTNELQASEEQLRKAKDAAEAANRAKSAFVANMSHELRSPLNVILGFAQVMGRNFDLAPEVHKNLEVILHSGEHLLSLINHVLDFSKIEAGHYTLDAADFDLFRLLDELEDMFILKAADKHLQLKFEYAADLPQYLRCDPVKLRQVLINLIGNALKFTERGGISVRISSSQAPSGDPDAPLQLRFAVEDSGPGIAADEVAGLFTAFTQTTSGRQIQEGTGLGLAISRGFVQLMGGDISVESQVGYGTTFTFYVQCKIAAPIEQMEDRRQRSIAIDSGQPNYRILVVDDSWVNRQLLIKLLAPLNFELREAESGEAAIASVERFQPHLVWMDIRMPGMDGVEATRRIKATAQGEKTVIIALTASVLEEAGTDAATFGCDDFLSKPFRAEDIYDLLGKHLGLRFSYAPVAPQTVQQVDHATSSHGSTNTALNFLSASLQARLIEGTELGDTQVLNRAISEVRDYDPVLAETLARMANRFDYDALLRLVREAGK